ncbi:MAG: CheY-like chemotaxis protein [Polaribacter sp.]
MDDDEINLIIGKTILEKLGHIVKTAANAHEAIEYVKHNGDSVEIIFMECQMPEIDSFEATTKIRVLSPRLPIIALTANTSKSVRAHAFVSGMNDFISKPFRPADIQEMIYLWC